MHRHALIAPPLPLGALLVRVRGVIEAVTADQPPYVIAGGPETRLVQTLAAPVFRFLPRAEALAGAVPGVAPAPLHQTSGRGKGFRWAASLLDDPNGYVTLHLPPPHRRDEAQPLPRVGMLAGSLNDVIPREHGFASPMPCRPETLAVRNALEGYFWFGAWPRLRGHLGRTAQRGLPSTAHWVWLTLHAAPQDVPLAASRVADAALLAGGGLTRMRWPKLGVPVQRRAA